MCVPSIRSSDSTTLKTQFNNNSGGSVCDFVGGNDSVVHTLSARPPTVIWRARLKASHAS